ncbi:hypothetical protein D3C86_1225490 [compost metagenome]
MLLPCSLQPKQACLAYFRSVVLYMIDNLITRSRSPVPLTHAVAALFKVLFEYLQKIPKFAAQSNWLIFQHQLYVYKIDQIGFNFRILQRWSGTAGAGTAPSGSNHLLYWWYPAVY